MSERALESYARILVIRLGALGDFVQSLGPMKAVREAHPGASITLLTTAPFEELAWKSGYFNDVWVDARPKWHQPGGWLALRRRLRQGRFERVYDLQTSGRTARYWRLMGRPEWSGHVPGCSHPDSNPRRNSLHTVERQAGQLADAGIAHVPVTDLSWAEADTVRFELPEACVLLVPGGATHRPKKRWPVAHYAALADALVKDGLTPVLIGGPAETEIVARIVATCPEAHDLAGKTTFEDIAVLARHAALAVGNDTGPMHLIAGANCPSVVLFSDESDPLLCAPRPGVAKENAAEGRVEILREAPLSRLPVADVARKAREIRRG